MGKTLMLKLPVTPSGNVLLDKNTLALVHKEETEAQAKIAAAVEWRKENGYVKVGMDFASPEEHAEMLRQEKEQQAAREAKLLAAGTEESRALGGSKADAMKVFVRSVEDTLEDLGALERTIGRRGKGGSIKDFNAVKKGASISPYHHLFLSAYWEETPGKARDQWRAIELEAELSVDLSVEATIQHSKGTAVAKMILMSPQAKEAGVSEKDDHKTMLAKLKKHEKKKGKKAGSIASAVLKAGAPLLMKVAEDIVPGGKTTIALASAIWGAFS